MPFIEISGFPGKVYVPEPQPDTQKKNKCPDCFSCQRCADIRCQICLNKNPVDKKCSCSENKQKVKKPETQE
jgi:hypothetical protein